ncbi:MULTISPECIES: hypothetical protein [Halobacterium]|uniref:hypothetical protein n=1 Tax=Halobacterium TaxID=2239 RepID=UPI000A4BCC36|nr:MULTISPECIES: hypothetical protein [Halobacterium]MCG1004768.1 hypothetical protein [Halobacterium noricense]
MTSNKLETGEVVEINDKQPAIVIHGGDPTGRTDTVPVVVSERGSHRRIKAQNWGPIDEGMDHEANYIAKPLDKAIAANRYASLYEQAVKEASGSIDTSELEYQAEKTIKEVVEETFGKCPDCGKSVINWANTTFTGVRLYGELSKLGNPEKIIRGKIKDYIAEEAAQKVTESILQNISNKEGLLDLEKNKHGEYVHASCSRGGESPVHYPTGSMIRSIDDFI